MAAIDEPSPPWLGGCGSLLANSTAGAAVSPWWHRLPVDPDNSSPEFNGPEIYSEFRKIFHSKGGGGHRWTNRPIRRLTDGPSKSSRHPFLADKNAKSLNSLASDEPPFPRRPFRALINGRGEIWCLFFRWQLPTHYCQLTLHCCGVIEK